MVKYLKPMQLFRESTKRTALLKQSTVLLGLNVCDKFVSCARSDRLKKFAFLYGCFERDERILDNLVDKVQECMSEYNVEGIVFASKLYPVVSFYRFSYSFSFIPSLVYLYSLPYFFLFDLGPPLNIHTLMDDIGKKGKFESLKYTCWKDDTTSQIADSVCNQFIDTTEKVSRSLGHQGEGHLVDLISARHMLQVSMDYFNTFVERKTYLFSDEMEDSE